MVTQLKNLRHRMTQPISFMTYPYSDKFLTLLKNLGCVLSFFLTVQVSSRAIDTNNYR